MLQHLQIMEENEAKIAELLKEVAAIQAQVDAVGRDVFQDFSDRLGIADIHDFHERVAERQSRQGHRRQSLLEDISKSSNSIQ